MTKREKPREYARGIRRSRRAVEWLEELLLCEDLDQAHRLRCEDLLQRKVPSKNYVIVTKSENREIRTMRNRYRPRARLAQARKTVAQMTAS